MSLQSSTSSSSCPAPGPDVLQQSVLVKPGTLLRCKPPLIVSVSTDGSNDLTVL